MKELAVRLAAGWDFMRVDFYSVADEVWFGEFSPYPGGGMMRFKPSSFDDVIGSWWRFPERSLIAGPDDPAVDFEGGH